MANIVRFRAGQAPEYLESVNTPDYSSDPDCIVNPNVSAVLGVPRRYWKRSGSSVLEMSAAEKAAVDAAEATLKDAAVSNLEIDAVTLAKALVRAGVVAKAPLVNAIKQVLNNQ